MHEHDLLLTRRSAIAAALAVTAAPTLFGDVAHASPPAAPHDFDFLVGHWNVRHRRLTAHFVGSTSWEEFTGTTASTSVLGGTGNVADNVFNRSTGIVRGLGISAMDISSGEWFSWWLNGGSLPSIDPPLRGRFFQGVGTFAGNDTLDGKPIRVRVQWSKITKNAFRWEQAYSADEGNTWEVNTTGDFRRATVR